MENKPEKKSETEDEMKVRIRAEVVKDLTKQNVSTPSGTNKGFAQIEKDYSEGKIPFAVYSDARKKEGIN